MVGNRHAILNFHGIGRCYRPLEDGEESVWVDEAKFSAFVEEIAAQNNCEITFDDGNKSDVEIALPALLSCGLRGKFFILTGRIGTPGFLEERDIQLLRASGMEVGLHGRDHVSWRAADDQELEREIVEAKSMLENVTGSPVTEAACPFGDYGRRALNRLRSAGFSAIYTSDGGVADTGCWLRPRRTIRSTDRTELIGQLFCEPFPARILRSAKISVKKLR